MKSLYLLFFLHSKMSMAQTPPSHLFLVFPTVFIIFGKFQPITDTDNGGWLLPPHVKPALRSSHRGLRCPKRRDANPSGREDNDGHTGASVASNPGGFFRDDKKSPFKNSRVFF